MSSGDMELDDIIARVRAIGGMAKAAAPDCADAVEDELQKTIAKHTDPDGNPWQLTQDGREPLANAASELKVAAVGSRVFVRLKGPSARHNNGRARGGVVRTVIPDKGIPKPIAKAIKRVLDQRFDDIAKGG